jgi:hypothetical protein
MEQLQRNVDDLDTPGLDGRWFSEDNTPEDKEKTKQVLVNSTIQWRLLKKILRAEFKQKQLKISDFDGFNFEARRCYDEGFIAALQHIYKILP